MFSSWGLFVYRRRWLVLAASVLSLVFAFAVFLLGLGGELGGGDFSSQTEAGRAFELVENELPDSPPSFTVIFSSPALGATDPAFASEVRRALAPLRSRPEVASIRTAYDSNPPDPELLSRDGKRSSAVVELRGDEDELEEAYPDLRRLIRSDTLEVIATGGIPLDRAFDTTLESDLQRAELVSLPLALIMLLLVFGSVLAACLPLGVGLLAVIGGFAGTLLLARVMNVSVYATNVVTMIGLGVAIDYSLFVVSRFREEVGLRPAPQALAVTMATAGRAILFSGLTVAIGLMGMMFFSLGNLGSVGVAGTIVVAMAVIFGLTFLPALLAILGPRVNALRVPFIHPERSRTGRGVWHRLAATVMARPWRVLLPVVALLLLLGSPVLNLRVSNGDHTLLPSTAEARRGVELLEGQFPGSESNRVTVVLNYPEGSPLTAERIGGMYDLSQRLEALPNVTKVESVVSLDPNIPREGYIQLLSGPRDRLPAGAQEALRQSVGERIAVMSVYTPLRANSDAARELVRSIRDLSAPAGGQLMVTGFTAFDIDTIQSVVEDVPVAVGFIVIATYIVLFLLLGSLLLPLKAVLMNFLSISASYGALVWIFQQGHLSNVLGFTPNPIETSTPVILFCVVFGLSMDYEVLLLSRVKEEYDRTGNNAQAVAFSLERTGRLITGAAAIMAAVFFSFGLAETVIIKAIGLGMGLAIAIDATIIRALMVPATMRLLGRWNWWAPAPLSRLYQKLGLGHEEVYPEPVLAGADGVGR